MNIYKINYVKWNWYFDEWESEKNEQYVAAQNEDEALSKVFVPLLKEHRVVELKCIKQIIVG